MLTQSATLPAPLSYGARYVRDYGRDAARDRIAHLDRRFAECLASGLLKTAAGLSDEAGNLRQALESAASRDSSRALPAGRRIALEIRNNGGANDSRHDRHFIDGKRVEQSAFFAIKSAALTAGTWESLGKGGSGGAVEFYYSAKV